MNSTLIDMLVVAIDDRDYSDLSEDEPSRVSAWWARGLFDAVVHPQTTKALPSVNQPCPHWLH